MEFRIISIGALSRHDLWGEKVPTRTAHATTTLIQAAGKNILVDPGLPAEAISARLTERSGLRADQITDVFLTNFRPAHRWGLSAFTKATVYVSEMERESIGKSLIERFQESQEEDEQKLLKQEIELLHKTKAAPDRLVEQVDLFPLPGFTPGTCGLLLLQTNSTTLIAGDAVPTVEHLEQGQVMKTCADLATAQESFREAIEIADVIIAGHDNLMLNPTRRPF